MSDLELVTPVAIVVVIASGVSAWLLRGQLARLVAAVSVGLLAGLAFHAEMAVRLFRSAFPGAIVALRDLQMSAVGIVTAVSFNLLMVTGFYLVLRRYTWGARSRVLIVIAVALLATGITVVCKPWRLGFDIY